MDALQLIRAEVDRLLKGGELPEFSDGVEGLIYAAALLVVQIDRYHHIKLKPGGVTKGDNTGEFVTRKTGMLPELGAPYVPLGNPITTPIILENQAAAIGLTAHVKLTRPFGEDIHNSLNVLAAYLVNTDHSVFVGLHAIGSDIEGLTVTQYENLETRIKVCSKCGYWRLTTTQVMGLNYCNLCKSYKHEH